MSSARAALRYGRRAGLWLALAAMVLRLAMPAGWMPAPSAAHSIPIVMCTMEGPVKMEMPADPAPKPAPAKKSHETCPFGAAPHFATLTVFLPASAPILPAEKDAVFRPEARLIKPRGHAPQSSRGPPLAA